MSFFRCAKTKTKNMVAMLLVEEAVRLSWWLVKGGGGLVWWGMSRAIWGAPPTREELERRKLKAIKDSVRDELDKYRDETNAQMEVLMEKNAALERMNEKQMEQLSQLTPKSKQEQPHA